MTRRVRARVAGTAIVTIVVLATAAACSSDPPDDPQAIPLPARGRRADAGTEDVASNVLQPVDGGSVDTGPPPDGFCRATCIPPDPGWPIATTSR